MLEHFTLAYCVERSRRLRREFDGYAKGTTIISALLHACCYLLLLSFHADVLRSPQSVFACQQQMLLQSQMATGKTPTEQELHVRTALQKHVT